MSSRYTVKSRIKAPYFAEDLPVGIMAGVLIYDNKKAKSLVKLKFKNLSERQITSLEAVIYLKDVDGATYKKESHEYANLQADCGMLFGADEAIALGENYEKIGIGIKKITFAEGEDYISDGAELKNAYAQNKTKNVYKSKYQQIAFAKKFGTKATKAPEDFGDVWLCTCSAPNVKSEACCSECGAEKELLFSQNGESLEKEGALLFAEKALGTHNLASLKESRDELLSLGLENEEITEKVCRRIAEIEAKRTARKRKTKIILGTSIPGAAIVTGLVLFLFLFLLPYLTYTKAEEKYVGGSNLEAYKYYHEVMDFDDSYAKMEEIEEIVLDKAKEYASVGNYRAAFNHLELYNSVSLRFEYTQKYSNYYHAYRCASNGEWRLACESFGLTNIILGYGDTQIDSYEFSECPSLKKVIILDSVTSIGDGAFAGCHSLTDVIIGSGVTSISDAAFSGCTSLESITIGNSVTSIGNYAFYNCSSLTSVTIPDSVTEIGNSAFRGCSSLTGVTIGNSVTKIGDYAFEYCSLLASVTIPDSVTEIGDYAFDGCPITYASIPAFAISYIPNYYLEEVVVTSGTEIADYAFNYCSSLTSVTIPDSVTRIGEQAFWNCSSLASITIPDSVTSIGSYAFYECSSLTSVTIPDSVTTIGDYAFGFCSSLTSVTIGNSVTEIGDYAFYDCSLLEGVYITDIAAWCNITFGDYNANPLSYSSNLYLNGELVTEIVIPEGVTSIGNYAFSGCSSLTSITIPDSVTSIGDDAFSGCHITYASIPAFAISYIPDYYLEDVVITSGTEIADYAFNYCSSLTSVTIPDSVTSIGDYAFSGCSSLTSITIPDSVTSIGNSAFSGCSSLTSVTIPDSVTSIGNSAFYNCPITYASIPAFAISYIPDYYLEEVVITSGTEIADYAFEYCYSLTSVTIPDSVTEIGYRAFYYCSSLTIYCEAASKPSGWDSYWNESNVPVVWGYTVEEFTYDFVTNGAESIPSVTTDRAFELPSPTMDGWVFCGWYDNAELEGEPISGFYSSKSTHTLYAKWMSEEDYNESTRDGSSFEKAFIINDGESLAANISYSGQYVYFKFTATEGGYYYFYSSGSYDTYGYLYDESENQLTSNDDGGTNSNFSISEYIYEGEVVYIVVRFYYSSSTGSFTVCVD